VTSCGLEEIFWVLFHGIEDLVIKNFNGVYQVPFLISITPTNDEEPIISVANVTCNEGFMKVLTLDVVDLDRPKDEVRLFACLHNQNKRGFFRGFFLTNQSSLNTF